MPQYLNKREALIARLHAEANKAGDDDHADLMRDAAAALAEPAAPGADDLTELKRLAAICPELNLSNYGPDDVDELNGWAIEVAQEIDRLAATPTTAQQVDSMENHHGRRDDYQRLDRGSAVLLRASAAFPMAGFANSEIAERLWSSEAVMAVNADLGLSMDQLVRLVRAIFAQPAAQQAAEWEPTREDLIAGLKFYADREHFNIADDSAWDTVSGEPQNFWCDEAGTATVEDGTIAAKVLAGELKAEHLKDEDSDATPATQPAEPSELVNLLQRAVRRLEIEHSHGGSIMREWIAEARAALAKFGGGR